MKKLILVILCVMTLCSFAVLATSLKVRAAKPGYSINNYLATTVPTMDGNWTSANEWTDAEERELDGTLTVYFRLKYAQSGSTFYQYILIDFLNDTTDDSGDAWSLCFDGHHDNASSPQTDDYKIDLVGHSFSGLHVYRGTGTDWIEIGYNWGSDLLIMNNINPSPHLSTPHWIAEFKINSTWLSLLNNYDLRVAAYDASSAAGNQVWPSSTSSVPNDWGLTITKFTQIPEFPSFLILPLFMTATLLALIVYRRKRSF